MSQSTLLTFLFTDIESSTRLWDDQQDFMRTLLARNDRLMRSQKAAATFSRLLAIRFAPCFQVLRALCLPH